ncbi:hypothetical protein [Serratia phage vB_SmaM_Yaphecito]|uniref:Uncharacterized protein n=1 Tax=Serratia phage vB_SmaM_Yaphecito TaxID=2777368 RepID=A0A7T3NC44_9CAUD|nr:hypothetical protein [Serratia phage vB_SmaM_Yaphecito]
MKTVEKKIRSELQIANYERYFGDHSVEHARKVAELATQLAEFRWTGHCPERVISQYRSSDYWERLLGINYKTYCRLVSSDHYKFIMDYLFKMENAAGNYREATKTAIKVFYAISGYSQFEDLTDVEKASIPFIVNMDIWRRNIIASDFSFSAESAEFLETFVDPIYVGMDTFQFDEDNDDESWGIAKVTTAKELLSLMVAVSRFILKQDEAEAQELNGHGFPDRIG